jgi:hypothetical protein
MEKTATVEHLMEELEVEEQLNAMIGRRLKQLLFLRGLKSLSPAPPAAPRPRFLASTKAA